MGLFDDYMKFDPAQFEAGGGLYGRLASLQPQLSFDQPTQGSPFPPVPGATGLTPAATNRDTVPTDGVTAPGAPLTPSSWPRDDGQTLNMRIGDYWMPQFGRAEPPAPVIAPTFGDRLNAGFQSWAHTPLGNPFAGLANGIAGFNTGQSSADWNGQYAPESPSGQGVSTLGIAAARGPAAYLRRRGVNDDR
ncbi:hypothetical protein [Bradyrhizobium sp. Ce-3]|uniref:hypothetical protein n=1 Tax=Bradyrhizobium sp. Ce-3 TaxID=2913970 RepID=UPI001FC82C84|nr:hypothetical protein [Bradyrhizobium sp. Ce-3]GKQ52877.1 hypothetical protein BRSPCE3_37320 [Bradyrhizobium sp. Ce-3]